MSDPFRDYDRLQTALQLVSEAYEVLNARESTVDITDWSRSARRLLEEFDRLPDENSARMDTKGEPVASRTAPTAWIVPRD